MVRRSARPETKASQNKWIAVGLILLLVGTVYYFRGYLPFSTGGVLAVSNIYIDPLRPGSEQDGIWVGGHWVVLANTYTAYGQHVFYYFGKPEVDKYSQGNTTNQGPAGQILLPNASIEIDVTVGQPYLQSHLISYDNMKVLPDTYGWHSGSFGLTTDTYFKEYKTYDNGVWNKRSDGPIPEQDITYWRTTNDWTTVVPLDISAWKKAADGSLIALLGPGGSTVYHTEATGSGALLPFSFTNPDDQSETVGFQLQGQLSSGISPNPGSFFILRSPDYVFRDSQDMENYIKFGTSTTDRRAFVNDWFGTWWHTHTDGSIYVNYDGTADQWNQPNGYPGLGEYETNIADVWKYPIKVTYDQLMFSGTPYTVASGRPNSLAKYLAAQRGAPLTAAQINPYTSQFTVDTTNRIMRLPLDWNSYLWLYTIDISTQLADTYVWKPSYTTGLIQSAVWMSGQSIPHIPVGGSDTMNIAVKNTGTYTGGLTLKFAKNPTSAPLAVNDFTVSLGPGITQVLPVSVSNLGTTTEVDVHITISLWNANNEHQGTDITLECILSPSGGADTFLTVVTQNRDNLYISGIPVTVQFGISSVAGSTSNGAVTFNLGLYVGPVTVTTAETDVYWSTNATLAVQAGSNTDTITLTKKGEPGQFPLIIVIVVLTMIGLVGAVVVLQRKKRLPIPQTPLTKPTRQYKSVSTA